MSYSKADIEKLWVQEGGDPKAASTAAAVALAESGGKQSATNHNTNGTVDKGLFQINSIHGQLSTYDLAGNVRAAIKISQGGTNWSPWVTYQTGAYKRFKSTPGGAARSRTSGGAGTGPLSDMTGQRTTTTPGKSFAPERAAAAAEFLGSGRNDSQNNLDFALQIRGLQDEPNRTVQTTSPSPVSGSATGQGTSGSVADLTARANALDAQHLPYKWGGGHAGRTSIQSGTPVDCSGAVSAVLGIDPRVSGQFEKFGKPGADPKGVTIYANGHHVLMEIGGHFFGTSQTNPGGGAGWIKREAISPAYLKGFVARHL